jgi:hypothetical protein
VKMIARGVQNFTSTPPQHFARSPDAENRGSGSAKLHQMTSVRRPARSASAAISMRRQSANASS